MTCAACLSSAAGCAAHRRDAASIDVRVPTASLPEGLYIVHLGDGSGPTLYSLAPPAWGSHHEPVTMSRGALLAWLAEYGGAVTAERVGATLAEQGDAVPIVGEIVRAYAGGATVETIAHEHGLDYWQADHRLRGWVQRRLAERGT